MAYLGTQPNDVKKNTGLYTPSEILQLTKDGSWGGSLELIEEQTFSSTVAVVDFTTIKESKYDVHYMTLSNMKSAGDNQECCNIQLYESGTLETAGVYQIGANNISTITGLENYERRTTSADKINLNFGAGNTGGEQEEGYLYFYNLGNSSKYSYVTGQFVGLNNDGKIWISIGGAMLPQASVVDGIRVLKNTGDYAGFNIKLYGVKQI